MVSLRRRRLLGLGLCCEIPPVLDPLPRVANNGTTPQNFTRTNPVSVHPMPSNDANQPDGNTIVKAEPRSLTASGSILSKEQHDVAVAGPPIKRRKRHRRKHAQNQEPCLMRGVYFKNMKWQAAIKVDKKQIHLGTVGSQEEAAHLYDRAAFMCGREPNFELSEGEKQELRKFKWDEFLVMTRHAITNKSKTQEKARGRVREEVRESSTGRRRLGG
nr:ethylene-responsive transcription factor-like protein At4g13040 isoform X3 [Malus domestica]